MSKFSLPITILLFAVLAAMGRAAEVVDAEDHAPSQRLLRGGRTPWRRHFLGCKAKCREAQNTCEGQSDSDDELHEYEFNMSYRRAEYSGICVDFAFLGEFDLDDCCDYHLDKCYDKCEDEFL